MPPDAQVCSGRLYDVLGTLLDHALVFVTGTWQLLVLLTLLAVLLRKGAEPFLRRFVLRLLSMCARTPPLAAAVVSLAVSLTVFAVRGEPLPEVHDDYSQLLLADTLRHGRLANPPHPFAAHFETMLALQRPSYASHFPPATGVVLASTWAAFGLPILGIWLVAAAGAASICWAARPWLPRSWSVLAGVLVACHPTIVPWGASYSGGSVAFFAGALLLGASARLARRPSHALGALAAAAIVILANSRPFEGLVYTIAVAVAFSIYAWRAWPGVLRRSAAALCILIAGGAAILVYNRAVTGDPLLLPHTAYDRQYTPAPNFIWEGPKQPPPFPNAEMAMAFKSVYMTHDRLRREPGGELRALDKKLDVLRWSLFPRTTPGSLVERASLLLYAPLFFLPRVLRTRRRNRPLLAIVLLFLAAPFMTAWWASAHYLAPAGAAVAILYMLCLRQCFLRSGTLTFVLLALAVCLSLESIVAQARAPQNRIEVQRQRIVAALEREPGQHLILVPPDVFGCVYNAADIDGARVVWARELTPDANAALLEHFGERRVWRLVNVNGRLRIRSESRAPRHPRPLP